MLKLLHIRLFLIGIISTVGIILKRLTEILFAKKPWFNTEPSSIAKELAEISKIGSGSTVLDLGCGYGKDAEYFARLGAHVNAINLSRKELAYAKAHSVGNVNYIYASADNIPFPNATYDAVLDSGCSHQCDHKTQLKIVQEVTRVLKPKGYLMYFGFSKDHPAFKINSSKDPDYNNPYYRSIDDLKKQYESYFDILKVETKKWKGGKYGYHEGLNVLMRKK